MRMTTDVVVIGGGEFLAALRPVVGRDKVVRFYTKTNERRGPSARLDVRLLNGLPALVIEFTDNAPREASCMVMRCDLAPDGRIKVLHSVLASHKLTAVRFVDGGSHDHPACSS